MKICLGPGYCLPKAFLERYAAADVPEVGNDEMRLPYFGELFGFELRDTGFYGRWFDTEIEKVFNANGDEIPDELILEALGEQDGRRAFHPYRRLLPTAILKHGGRPDR